MNIIIETERLIIREFENDDLLNLYKIESDSRIIKYILRSKLKTLSECKRQLKNYILNYKTNKLNSWAVVEKESNEVIGITQLVYNNKIKGVEIGTKILLEYWSKGYASELTRELVHYGLYELNLPEITAITDINNAGAIKSLINMGMTLKKYGYYYGTEAAFYSLIR